MCVDSYAWSTTTYKGFQAIMTEEQSEKFKGNFVLFSLNFLKKINLFDN